MDGVISDTQVIHSQVESDLLKEYGLDIHPDEITKKYAGTTSYQMFPHVFQTFEKEMPPIEEMVSKKRERIDKAVRGAVREVPGTRDFINFLKLQNMPTAVASASRLSFIDLVLSELDLKDKFNAIASSEEVRMGKPEPDVFLLAAERLGASPKECLVIEDGIHGMVAARKAGMYCVGLVRDDDHDINVYPADILVKDLREVRLEDL